MLRSLAHRSLRPAAARLSASSAVFRAPAMVQQRFMSMAGSKTLQNLKDAFAGEAMAATRYEYYAQRADVEGYPDLATLFRGLAEGEKNHAMGHLEFLAHEVGDPVTNQPIGNSEENINSALVGEDHDSSNMYPSFAQTARSEGFEEAAEWFETLAHAESAHMRRLQKALQELKSS